MKRSNYYRNIWHKQVWIIFRGFAPGVYRFLVPPKDRNKDTRANKYSLAILSRTLTAARLALQHSPILPIEKSQLYFYQKLRV
ncbi:MAG: hypothetical protein CVU87_01145 [Firmicutes bacterium HGW-Firmicutes-12]|nr:MAG: hypothetical protein CVU87_01145 [Firmicutes bacterium HGW-Firmicutes-12]